MAFSLYRGKSPSIKWFPKAASVAFNVGDAMKFDHSGAVTPAAAGDSIFDVISLRESAASDSDYAATTMIPCLVEDLVSCEFLVDVGTGTLTTAMVGSSYDLKDAGSIDVTAQVKNVVQIVQFISATKAVVAFKPDLL